MRAVAPQLSIADQLYIDQLCLDFEAALKRGEAPPIAGYIEEAAGPVRSELLRQLLLLELDYRLRRGEVPDFQEYCRLFPQDASIVEQAFRTSSGDAAASSAGRPEGSGGPGSASHRQMQEEPSTPAADSIPGYCVVREIHRGGQGVVYQAVQKTTRRKVAIKVMREGPFASRQDKARFEREVQVLAALKHPNIVAIHESGTAAGSFYFVMDYISGQPLEVYMAAGCRSVRETLGLFQRVCEAVNAAHLHGVIHRDLKPGNILINSEDEPQVLDFGLAKVARGQIGDESASVTMTGQFIGSLPWASPEQAEGIPARIDIRTDVYSLGVVLYQMLTGKFPYDVVGGFREVLDRIITAPPVRPRMLRADVDDEVETMVLKALAKERERRYQSAGELARDIGHYLADEPIEAKRNSSWYVLRKNLRRYRAPVAVTSGFVLVVTLALIISLFLLRVVAVERGRAVQARNDAVQKLWHAYLAQAQAGRYSGRPGRRLNSLEVLARAAAIRPSPDLRNQAIACMALTDLRLAKEWDGSLRPGYGLAFDTAMERYAVSDSSGHVSIRRLADNREIVSLSGPECPAWILQISPGGRYLAGKFCLPGMNNDARVWVWDLVSRQVVLKTSHNMSNRALDFSPDDRWLAISTTQGGIILYNSATGTKVRLLPSEGIIDRICFHPRGGQFAASTADGKVVIQDMTDGHIIRRLIPGGGVGAIAWDSEGELLAVACADSRIYVYAVASGQPQAVLEGHSSWPSDLVFSHTGDLLASGDPYDGTLRLWHPLDGSPLMTLSGVELLGCLLFGPGDRLLGPAGHGQKMMLFEMADAPECRRLLPWAAQGRRLWYTGISPDGHWLAGAYDDGVRLWDLRRGRQVESLPGRLLRLVTFSPDGATLIASGGSGLFRWRLSGEAGRGAAVPLFGPADRIPLPEQGEVGGHGLNRDGSMLAVAASYSLALLLDAKTGRETARFGGHTGLSAAVLSPDGKWLACCTWHGSGVRVFSVQTRQAVLTVPDTVNSGVYFSPDGQWLVTCTGPEYRLWSVPDWRPRWRMARTGTMDMPGPAAFTQDGRTLAVVPSWGIVQLIDVNTAREVAALEAPDVHQRIATLAFTPDGACLVAGNSARRLHVWDLRLIRQRLAAMGLDWDSPPLPPAERTETATHPSPSLPAPQG